MKRQFSYINNYPLYLLATPVGNLKDISSRTIEIINEVDYIACEDTRNTQKLLSFLNVKKPLVSLHEHNEKEGSVKIVEDIKNGKKVAYCSDAGYPAISDPGSILVKECLENDVPVSVIPGANAALMALVGSGLNSDHFYFHGFLSPKHSQQVKELEELKNYPMTLIFYEAPHRIDETLKTLYDVLGNRKSVIAREISKLHEEYIRGTLEELKDIDKETLPGEMVIIVEGKENDNSIISDEDIKKMLIEYIKEGKSKKEAVKLTADKTKLNKNKIYELSLKL